MCTAIYFDSSNILFGRTLDYEVTFAENVVLTPRNFRFDFRHEGTLGTHNAILGMAAVRDGYPLYFDAFNEKGLCIAALNFPKSACYFVPRADKNSVASFEVIPWILSRCDSVDGARELLKNALITDTAFSPELPPSGLHWLMADGNGCAVIEQTHDGLFVKKNTVGVLTNEPCLDKQIANLERYAQLSPDSPEGDSRGLGAVGLPGDLSSMSRFVRAAFANTHALRFDDDDEGAAQLMRIMGSVAQVKGCCKVGRQYEYTQYACVMSAKRGIYYYSTYNDGGQSAVDMHRENLNSTNLVCYKPSHVAKVYMQN